MGLEKYFGIKDTTRTEDPARVAAVRLGEQLRREIEETRKRLDALEEMSVVRYGLMQDSVDNFIEKDQRKKEDDLFSLAVKVVEKIYNDIPDNSVSNRNLREIQKHLSQKISNYFLEEHGELREPLKSYSVLWANDLSTGLFYGKDKAITMLLNNAEKRTPNNKESFKIKSVLERLYIRYDVRNY